MVYRGHCFEKRPLEGVGAAVAHLMNHQIVLGQRFRSLFINRLDSHAGDLGRILVICIHEEAVRGNLDKLLKERKTGLPNPHDIRRPARDKGDTFRRHEVPFVRD